MRGSKLLSSGVPSTTVLDFSRTFLQNHSLPAAFPLPTTKQFAQGENCCLDPEVKQNLSTLHWHRWKSVRSCRSQQTLNNFQADLKFAFYYTENFFSEWLNSIFRKCRIWQLFTEAQDTIVFHLSQCINYCLFKLNSEFCLGNVCNHLLIGKSNEVFFIFCFVYVPRSAKHVSLCETHRYIQSLPRVLSSSRAWDRGSWMCGCAICTISWLEKCLKYGKSFNQTLQIFPRWGTALQGTRLSTCRDPSVGTRKWFWPFGMEKKPVLY